MYSSLKIWSKFYANWTTHTVRHHNTRHGQPYTVQPIVRTPLIMPGKTSTDTVHIILYGS